MGSASTTARLFPEDLERARVIAAIRQQSPQEIIHVALAEYVDNHREELEGQFDAVQDAVLAGDRNALRRAFLSRVPRQVDADLERHARAWEGSSEE